MLHHPPQGNNPQVSPPRPPTSIFPPSTHCFELAQHPHGAPGHLTLPIPPIAELHRPSLNANSDDAWRPPPPATNSAQSHDTIYQAAPPHTQYAAISQGHVGALYVKRKQSRATQACSNCRTRKQKCDEQRPCQYCKDNRFECFYKELPLPKADRSIMQLQSTVEGAVVRLEGLMEIPQTLADMRKMLEAVVAHTAPVRPAPVEAESPSQTLDDITAQHSHHTTTPHHLLKWPGMEMFYEGIDYLEQLLHHGHELPNYPMRVELDRGTFCVWDAREIDKPSHEDFISPSSCAFTSRRLESHLCSYLGTFHILHPFLDPNKLHRMVDGIKSGPVRNTKALRVKRKRQSEEPPHNTEGKLSDAIALLIAALGATAMQPDLPTLYSASSANASISPGMVYFAPAWNILLTNSSKRTILYAQAMILASLYLNQYGRVFDGWRCIKAACDITYDIVIENMARLMHESKVIMSEEGLYEAKVLKLAYWTCLQLESDILAEWSTLPSSKIPDLQDVIGFPHYYEDPSAETSGFMFAHSGQIWLRRFLNKVPSELYGGDDATDAAGLLEEWKTMQPPEMSWCDSDTPSSDVNLARLRAKYYGAKCVVFQGSLHHAIKYPEAPPDIQSIHKCIENAIQSTIAFDRVGADAEADYTMYERQPNLPLPALTNIVGTLHAQSGNMTLLAAAYNSHLLSLLPENTNLTKPNLSALLRRTIYAMSPYIGNSPILSIDFAILRTIRVACDL